jgi:hypothetical protein
MSATPFPRAALALAGALLVLGCLGCQDRSYSKYVPAEDQARQALEAALGAWKSGKKFGPVEGASPAVQVVDSRWQAGHKLQSFEVLGEEPGDGPKVFSVRLTLQRPAGQKVVRYVVLGKDPLWVYREDDYKAPAGM